MITIRPLTRADRSALAAMRHALLQREPALDEAEFEALCAAGDEARAAAFVAEVNGVVVGLVEIAERSHADSCDARRPVGYIEGWFVEPAHRRSSVGRALMLRAEEWTRSRGLAELGSDAELGNRPSRHAHVALGFEEGGEVVCMRRALAHPITPAGGITIRPMAASDRSRVVAMRAGLWPDHPAADEAFAVDEMLAGRPLSTLPMTLLLACESHEGDEGDGMVGFVEVGLRSFAEGCSTGRVGYIEGWFVEERARRRGVGRTLIAAAEQWARDHGCSEMGSDTEIENTLSLDAHHALGYREVTRLVNLRKSVLRAG